MIYTAARMGRLKDLISANAAWADRLTEADPEFFQRLSRQQSPRYLWIGCSDSRVPANQIVGLLPGEIFVHRNIANLVVHTDLNCLSVIQFAVDVLKIRDIIVCGHYGCTGVRAALHRERLGLADNWIRHIQDVQDRNIALIEEGQDEEARLNQLCELNVIEQARNVRQTSIVRDAWARGQDLAVHGWIYSLHDGRVRDLGVTAVEDME